MNEITLILLVMAGFVGWKLHSIGIHSIKFHLKQFIQYDLWLVYHRLTSNEHTWCKIRIDLLDDVYDIIRRCPTITSWDICDFIQGKLGINETQRYQLLRTLENLGRIKLVYENGWYYWRTCVPLPLSERVTE